MERLRWNLFILFNFLYKLSDCTSPILLNRTLDNMKVSRSEIAERLKSARTALTLNQKEIASKSGVGFSTYQKYEMALSKPGTDALFGFMRSGINANWLLSGEGSMLLADVPTSNEKPSPLDVEVLTYVIEEIEKTLDKSKRVLSAQQKAALIQLIYDYCIETGKNDAGTVERFLKLVG